MAGDAIASAFVVIRPDLSGFRDDLRAGLDEAVAGVGDKTVRINADTADAEAAVASLDGSLDELGAKTPTPRVEVSDDDARAKLTELQARIDELASEAATVKIGVDDTSTRRTITDLQSALDSFRNETLVPALDPARLEAINGELDGLDYKLRTVDNDLQSTSNSADKAASSLGKGGAGSAGGGLLAMAAAAAPALLTVGAVGAGAMASIAVASSAATVGIGAFGLAAQPALQAAKTDAQGLLETWQQTEAGFTSPVIANAVGLLPGVFNLLSPSVAATSVALQGLEGQLAGSIGSPYWHQFSSYIAGEGGAAISGFGTLVGGLATLFSGLAEGLAPELQTISGDVGRWAQDLDKWGQDAANGGLSQFISYIQQNGPLLANDLKEVGSDIATLAKASAPLGPVWLNIIDVAAKLVGELEQLNPTLTTWAVGLGSVAFAANKLAAPIGGLSGLATQAKSAWSLASDAFSVGATGLSSVALASTGAGASISAFLGSSLALVPGVDLLGAAILQSTGAFSNFDQAVNAAGKSWSQNFVNSLGAGTDKVAAVKTEIASLQGQVSSWASLMQQSAALSTDDWNTAIDKLPPSLQALGQALIEDGADPTQKVSTAVAGFQSSIESVNGQITGLQKILPGLTSAQDAQNAAVDQANTAMGTAAGYTGSLASQYGTLTTQLQNANQAVRATTTSLNNMLGSELSAAQNTTAFYQAVGSLTTSLQTNGTQLDGTTTKALNNQQAFEGVGTAVNNVIGSMEKQGATSDQIVGKVQDLTGYLESQAGQYGLTTGQVEAYLTQLGLTPAQVKTDLELSGYDQAASNLNSIQSKLNALPTQKTITITTLEQTITAGGGHISGTTLANQGFATGTSSAPGGPAWVGEQGPEAMRVGSAWQLVGVGGPQIVDVPAGATILTASQTAKLPRYADGVGNDQVTGLLGGEPTQLLGVTAYAVSQLPGLMQASVSQAAQSSAVIVGALAADTQALSAAFSAASQVSTSNLGSAISAALGSVNTGLGTVDQDLTSGLQTLGQDVTNGLDTLDQAVTSLNQAVTSGLQSVQTAVSTISLGGGGVLSGGGSSGSPAPLTGQAALDAITAQLLAGPNPSNWDYNVANGVAPGGQSALDAITQQLLSGPNPSNWSFDTSLPNGVPWWSLANDTGGQPVHATTVNYSPTLVLQGTTSDSTVAQVHAMLDQQKSDIVAMVSGALGG